MLSSDFSKYQADKVPIANTCQPAGKPPVSRLLYHHSLSAPKSTQPPPPPLLPGKQTPPAPIGPRGEWLTSKLDSSVSRSYTLSTPCTPPPPIVATLPCQQKRLLWVGCSTSSHIGSCKLQVPLCPQTLTSPVTSGEPWDTDTSYTDWTKRVHCLHWWDQEAKTLSAPTGGRDE